MKRVFLLIVALVAVFAVCGLLAVLHVVRTAVAAPPISDPFDPTRPEPQPMDAWQALIKPDTRTDYTPDPAATKRLMEKLRREEIRQHPQEGIN